MTTAGVVLAGGRSRRMGTDKAGLRRDGTPLLAHVLAVLAAAVDGPLVVVGAADSPRELPLELTATARARCTVVADPVADRGPLQGLATGLGAARAAGTAFVAAVDLPHLHEDLVRAVLAHRTPPVEVALPVLDGHRQHLLAAYATDLAHRADDLLERGERSVGALIAASRVRELDAATLLADPRLAARDPELLGARGVNTPEEWDRAQRERPGPPT
ncbi:molybdenum cofactor guanylyltransferase [Actinomycetospora succinea]|uniref:Probable molybdenum cofactor guanylyltransferase n=1 Tax=Actinomycetospora succinea TaxID=663603 RepID=A0A4R6VH34_9PSEU|nr:molybdenum cofactor guanylyltransferase [Actinomycetospora succinea]TDQ60677.1 molybdenum cofactor guanylyltransferase [Actinomycetospora succinea]